MRFAHKAIAAGLAGALIFGVGVVPAYAVPLEELQAQLEEVSQKLDELGAELAEQERLLSEYGEQLEEIQYRISEKETQIAETEEELASARQLLGSRMRSSYKSGVSSMLEVLLSSSSFEQLVSRIYYMDKIVDSDAEAIEAVSLLELQLESQKAELLGEQEKLEAKLTETQSQVESYQAKVSEARDYYNSLDAEIQAELERIAAEEEARRQAEEEARRQAEEEARRREEAAAAAAAASSADGQSNSNRAMDAATSDDSGSSASTFAGSGVDSAYSCIGCPYVWGATGPSGFDCSGLVCYCYGYNLGRTTYDMISSLQASGRWKTSMDQLNYGDLVFPHTGHVGIYIGGGQMIHAPYPGASVCVQSVYAFYGGGSYY